MLRILSYIPLSVHLVSIALILLLRLPSFFDLYITDEEALYLLISKTLSSGGYLYRDAWFAGPPVMPGLYLVLHYLFGDGALLASRILACIYLYISAIYFNGLLSSYKLFKRYPGLPAILLIFLLSSPWYTLQFSASLFVLLPMILALHTIIRLGEHPSSSYQPLFFAGVWVMVAILTSYKVLFFMAGILLSYILLKKVRIDEIVTLFGGALTLLLVWLVRMYLIGTLGDYWDVGILYYLDRAGLSETSGYAYSNWFSLKLWVYMSGPILFLALIGLIHFRTRYFSFVAKIRGIDVLMGIWLISVMSMLAFKWRRLEYSDFILVAPPIAFYATKTFDFYWVHRLRILVIAGILAFPMYVYFGFWALNFGMLDGMTKHGDSMLLHGDALHEMRDYEPVVDRLRATQFAEGIWVMANKPAIYQRLKAPCANRYVDFRIVKNKFACLPGGGTEGLISQIEPDLNIYRQLTAHPPDFVIEDVDNDSTGNFRYLQERFPGPLSGYSGQKAGAYMIYSKP